MATAPKRTYWNLCLMDPYPTRLQNQHHSQSGKDSQQCRCAFPHGPMNQRKGVPRNCTLKEVPTTTKEQEDLIQQEHQKAHQGQTTTEEKIRRMYQHWPHLRTQVRNVLQRCDTCQKHQGKKNYQAPLQPIPPPVHIFQRWRVDVIGPLPVILRRNKYILVFVEHLTKWPEAYPMEIADALTIVGHLHDLAL